MINLNAILKDRFFEDKILSSWNKIKFGLKEIDKKYKNFTGSVYSVSDLHLPFQQNEKIKDFFKFINKDKNEKIIVVNGDMLDMTNFKYFNDDMPVISLEEELWLGKKFCKLLNNYTDEIIFLFANHEKRLMKRLKDKLNIKQANDIIKQLKSKMIDDFQTYRCKIVDNWFLKIGNLGFVHPEQNSATRGKTASDICEWFYDRVPSVNIWFIAHTHKQNIVGYKKHFGIETGCLCSTMDYAINPKLFYKNEQQYYGFGFSEMKNGKTDINNSRFINLGCEKKIL